VRGKLLGHKALELLIDRTPDSGPSEVWQKTVIGIAGDPRVGWRSKSFQNWWQILGEERAKKVVGWLSRLDLRIFLEVLEASARKTNTESIRRMYPPRKKFMEGLLEQGMVVQSRLFLSRDASMYLRSNYDADDVPEHAVIMSGHTSVIYLELTGGLHMVEGTDNMKIKILDALPSRPQILNFMVRRFNDTDFRADLVRTYIRDQNAKNRSVVPGKDYIDQAHTAIAWQASAISLFNKRGIKYDASKFFSSSDYRLFKTSYSRSYWS
jgi:nicotinamide mononucleotide adenylyltransferase